LTAARTPRRTASLTKAWSFRRGRGIDSMVPMAASRTMVSKAVPFLSVPGIPDSATSGSASSAPLSESTSDTDTVPAKLSFRRSRTCPSSERVMMAPSR
jgi:hypothetical protein